MRVENSGEHVRILLGHPGRQHSYRLATALKKAGLLDKYMTTVYYGKNQKSLTRWVTNLLKGDIRDRASGRVCQALDDEDVVKFGEALGLMTLAAYRIDPSGRLPRLFESLTSWYFQVRVANYAIRNKVDAVIMYDCNARHCFRILARRAPEITRIIDNAHPARNYLYEVYQQHMHASGVFALTLERQPYLFDRSMAAVYGREARLAQYHIVASKFSRDSVRFNGFTDEEILLVPYGVDSGTFKPHARPGNTLNVLFVGEINQRKGIAQILEAAVQMSGQEVSFELVGGGQEFHRHLYDPFRQYVSFRGRISFAELIEAFGRADVFVFPSIGEGFGLVVLEALSAGLPVISSTNCVGADVIADFVNGFVIPAGDTQALVERIEWLAQHPDELARMGKAAEQTAREFTWERYEQAIADLLRRKLLPSPDVPAVDLGFGNLSS